MLLHTCGNGNAMVVANTVEPEDYRMGERVANKEGSPPYKRGASSYLYEEKNC